MYLVGTVVQCGSTGSTLDSGKEAELGSSMQQAAGTICSMVIVIVICSIVIVIVSCSIVLSIGASVLVERLVAGNETNC